MNKQVEQIKTEIERLKESGCASPIVICDTLLAFIDSMREESKPKFKVGQTITDPTDSTFTFHINKIEDGRYIEKEDEWVLVKEADANYELVEEPISEDLDEEDSFDELLQKLYIKYNKGVSIEKLLDIASNFVKWQKEKDRKSFELLKEWFKEIAERCSHLTSGNVSHNGKAIRGFARNCAEYIKTDLL